MQETMTKVTEKGHTSSLNNQSSIISSNNKIKNNEHPKLTLTWERINVYTENVNTTLLNLKSKLAGINSVKGNSRHIISNVSGIARPYEVLAIMGASGAGKSTLLNILNSCNRGSLNIEGDIKINGRYMNKIENLNSVYGYVQQNDLFVGNMKVKEHLLFQAMLRMDKHATKKEREERVNSVIENLNLTKCKDSLIGNPERGVKGISGGEMRRLSFASEIITDPSILFCDEPTSGLDSFMAMSIVESMKSLAKSGKTIICTIHQPSSEVFEKFDKICFLSEGKLAYIGDQSMASDFFDRQGYKCPEKYNPADYIIKTLSVAPSNKNESLERINKICAGYVSSSNFQEINKEIHQTNLNNSNTVIPKSFIVEKSSMITQIRWLFWRNFLEAYRDPLVLKLQFFQTFFIAILYGLIFFKLNLNQQGIQNINGVMFICIINITFGTLFSVIDTFPREIPLFIRESQNGMYRVVSYYISKTLMEFPTNFMVPLLFLSIFYWMVDLNGNFRNFVVCCIIIIEVAYTTAGYSQFISLCSSSRTAPTELAGPLIIPFFIFSGFFLHNNTIPRYFLIFKYMSWFGYANEAMLINQWNGIENIGCDTKPYLCFLSGKDILEYFNAKEENLYYNMFMLLYLIIGWKTLTLLMLMIRSYKK